MRRHVHPKIRRLNWKNARFVDGGGYAAVFRIGEFAAKVGQVDRTEAQLQRFYAKKKLALPVFDYQEEFWVPPYIRKKACPKHGPRRNIVAEQEECWCQAPLDVLLMPWANTTLTKEQIQEIRNKIAQEQELHPEQRPWDDRADNCASYNGRLVALDFGGDQ